MPAMPPRPPWTFKKPENLGEADALINETEIKGHLRHPEEVLRWRKDEFLRMGFNESMSIFLSDTNIDLHQMEDRLLKRGCDHMTAVDILLGTNSFGDDPAWGWNQDEEGE